MLFRSAMMSHAYDIIATLFPRHAEFRRERRKPQEEIVMGRQVFQVVVVR